MIFLQQYKRKLLKLQDFLRTNGFGDRLRLIEEDLDAEEMNETADFYAWKSQEYTKEEEDFDWPPSYNQQKHNIKLSWDYWHDDWPSSKPINSRWVWDKEKIIKPDLSYYHPEIIVWNIDYVEGSISLFEPGQELIAITEQPMLKNCQDSFSIEIVTSLSKNINVGVAAMVYDNLDTKDWVMLKGWYVNLQTLMWKREVDRNWNDYYDGPI